MAPTKGYKHSKPRTAEHNAKLAAALVGRKASPERRQVLRDAWAKKSYEEKLAGSAPGRAAAHPSKHKGRHNAAWWNALPEADKDRIRAARSAHHKNKWANYTEEQRAKRLESVRAAGMLGAAAAHRARPTSIERAVQSVLDSLGVDYEREFRIGVFIVDFFISSKRVVIECDGSYWHSKPEVIERDRRRDAWLTAQGYTVVRLPESDIVAGKAPDILRVVA